MSASSASSLDTNQKFNFGKLLIALMLRLTFIVTLQKKGNKKGRTKY